MRIEISELQRNTLLNIPVRMANGLSAPHCTSRNHRSRQDVQTSGGNADFPNPAQARLPSGGNDNFPNPAQAHWYHNENSHFLGAEGNDPRATPSLRKDPSEDQPSKPCSRYKQAGGTSTFRTLHKPACPVGGTITFRTQHKPTGITMKIPICWVHRGTTPERPPHKERP